MRLHITLLLGVLFLGSGCSRSGPNAETGDVKVDLALKPEPPKVGPAEAVVTLTDKNGQPVRGAAVKLEGNMNHAGMEPVFADGKEAEPGHYKAELNFTMGGDWFVLVNATLSDGRKLTRKVDVPGVKSR